MKFGDEGGWINCVIAAVDRRQLKRIIKVAQ